MFLFYDRDNVPSSAGKIDGRGIAWVVDFWKGPGNTNTVALSMGGKHKEQGRYQRGHNWVTFAHRIWWAVTLNSKFAVDVLKHEVVFQ